MYQETTQDLVARIDEALAWEHRFHLTRRDEDFLRSLVLWQLDHLSPMPGNGPPAQSNVGYLERDERQAGGKASVHGRLT